MAVSRTLRSLILPPGSSIPHSILLSNLRTSLKLSLCPLCTLRFLPCYTSHVYSTPPETLARAYQSLLAEKDTVIDVGGETTAPLSAHNVGRQDACRACVGILCEGVVGSLEERIRDGLKGVMHDGKWWLSAGIAGDIGILRQKVLRGEYENGDKWKEVDLKSGLRMVLGEKVRIDGMKMVVAAKHETPSILVELNFKGKGECDEAVVAENGDGAVVGEKRKWDGRGRRRRGRRNKKEGGGKMSNHRIGLEADSMSREELLKHTGPLEDWTVDGLDVSYKVIVGSVWVAGRYRKLARGISQTEWAGKEVRTSVEEIVRDAIVPVLGGKNLCFTAGGREDVDVRMLGSGRPFVVEIPDGKRVASKITEVELSDIRERVNNGNQGKGLVEVHDLKVAGRDYYAKMKESETVKRKQYRCVIWLERPANESELQRWVEKVNQEGGIMLKQKTPLRVLHRRTLMVRERKIWSLALGRTVSPGVFVLDVEAAAGTYIKEFVHGDLGRTVPNVGSMFNSEADILQLDVMGIRSDV